MNHIIFFGKDSKWNLAEAVGQYLKELIPFTEIRETIYKEHGVAPLLELIDMKEVNSITVSNGILVTKPKTDLSRLKLHCPNSIFLINSAYKHQIFTAAQRHLNVITIGLSAKDTITLSSRGEEKSVVSLQREITNHCGEIIEPMEIPFRHPQNATDDAILVSGAILILSQYFSEQEKS